MKKESDLSHVYPRFESASFSAASLGSADPASNTHSTVAARRHRDTSELYHGWASGNIIPGNLVHQSSENVSSMSSTQRHMTDMETYYASTMGHSQSPPGGVHHSSSQPSGYYQIAQANLPSTITQSNYESSQQSSFANLDGQSRAAAAGQRAINDSDNFSFGGYYDNRTPAPFYYDNGSCSDMGHFQDVNGAYRNQFYN